MKNKTTKLAALCALAMVVSACGSSKDTSTPNTPSNGMKSDTTPAAMNAGGSGGKAGASTNTDNKPAATGSGGASGGSAGMKADNTAMGSAGTAGDAGKGGTMPMMTGMDPNQPYPDPRGHCTIDSGFPDDNACLVAPDPSVGMQIHIGPTDYKNMDEVNKYVFHPGQEASECWTFHTPNDKQIYYQTFELSGRAGTHHIINTMYNIELTDGGFDVCQDGGTGTNSNIVDNLPGASKAYMARTLVAPEYMDVGRTIGPNTPSQADMHYFNFTDADILREFWMNIYFVPKEQIKRTGNQIRAMGGISWSFAPIQPGTDMVYQYTCPIDKDGAILELLGHYHSHGKRFTAYLNHMGGAKEKVFEMYDYKDPKTYQYDTITTNPMFSDTEAGATSGILNVKAGDSLDWECHVINDSDTALTYVNEVKTGEMCNLWGESLGPVINCVLP